EIAKLCCLLRISFVVVFCVGFVAVKRALQFPLFIQLLKPNTGCEAFGAYRVIRGNLYHFAKMLSRCVVVEVVKSFITLRTKFVEVRGRLRCSLTLAQAEGN